MWVKFLNPNPGWSEDFGTVRRGLAEQLIASEAAAEITHPVRSALAFFGPLLGSGSAVVEVDRLGQVGQDSG